MQFTHRSPLSETVCHCEGRQKNSEPANIMQNKSEKEPPPVLTWLSLTVDVNPPPFMLTDLGQHPYNVAQLEMPFLPGWSEGVAQFTKNLSTIINPFYIRPYYYHQRVIYKGLQHIWKKQLTGRYFWRKLRVAFLVCRPCCRCNMLLCWWCLLQRLRTTNNVILTLFTHPAAR